MNTPRNTGFFALFNHNLWLPLLIVLFLYTGCAKHPSATSRVDSVLGSAITKTAMKNVGIRYKSGGTSPEKGFDCSGLLVWSYAQHGIKLPRTAREQMNVGQTIRKEQLRPGDIVVFKIRRGLHTGIYAGNGKFVHSPSTGKHVRLDRIDAQYWQTRYVTSKRLPQLSR